MCPSQRTPRVFVHERTAGRDWLWWRWGGSHRALHCKLFLLRHSINFHLKIITFIWTQVYAYRFWTAEHTRQDAQGTSIKTGEETVTLLLPLISEDFAEETELRQPNYCLQKCIIWEKKNSTMRWLTTLTTHSALVQHIMMWLMCADEETALCGAVLSIILRWVEPRMIWPVSCVQGWFHQDTQYDLRTRSNWAMVPLHTRVNMNALETNGAVSQLDNERCRKKSYPRLSQYLLSL